MCIRDRLVGDHQLLRLGDQHSLRLVVADLLHLRVLVVVVRGLRQGVGLHVELRPGEIVLAVPGQIPQVLGGVHGLLVHIV